MLSPDAKAIWKSPAGGALMAALLGQHEPDDADRKTAAELAALAEPADAPEMATDEAVLVRCRSADRLAFDRATVRSVDQDGRLHVQVSSISKAAVNPYLGREIPGAEELGLQPDQVYMLFRDPEELALGAATFNNIPILNKHIPVSAAAPQKENIVGSTGTDAAFVHPYLQNSLVIWDAQAIDGIETEEQRELSSAYRYVADMTPGTYEGIPYQGVMREIRGNHVALVGTGRAGPDVIVGDEQLQRKPQTMSKPLSSRRALLAKGALLSAVKLAQDAAVDFDALLADVTAKNWRDKKPGIVAKLKPKLAADSDLASVVKLMDALDNEGDPNSDMLDGTTDADPCEEILAMLRGKVDDQTLAAVDAACKKLAGGGAMDTPPPTLGAPTPPAPAATPMPGGGGGAPPAPVPAPKPAMDEATVRKMVADAQAAGRQLAVAATEAREVVRPWVGALSMALDSADAIYKAALDGLGVTTDGIHPTALRAVLEAQPKPGESRQQRIAQDSGGKEKSALLTNFPGLATIKSV